MYKIMHNAAKMKLFRSFVLNPPQLNHPESDDVTRRRSDSYTQSDDRSSWDSLEETRTAKHEVTDMTDIILLAVV